MIGGVSSVTFMTDGKLRGLAATGRTRMSCQVSEQLTPLPLWLVTVNWICVVVREVMATEVPLATPLMFLPLLPVPVSRSIRTVGAAPTKAVATVSSGLGAGPDFGAAASGFGAGPGLGAVASGFGAPASDLGAAPASAFLAGEGETISGAAITGCIALWIIALCVSSVPEAAYLYRTAFLSRIPWQRQLMDGRIRGIPIS